MPRRLIAIGNDLRGDDAAGLIVARHLLELNPVGVLVEQHSGEVGALVEALCRGGQVDLVDAVAGPEPPGTVLRLGPGEVRDRRRTASSHGLGLAEAIALAEALGMLPEIRLHGIVGRRFGLGDPVSEGVEGAAQELAAEIAADRGMDRCV